MKVRQFEEIIAFPEDVSVEVAGQRLVVKGKMGEVTKIFKMPRFSFTIDGNNIKVSCKGFGVYDRRNLMTFKAHVKNMITGAQEGFTYKLKICSSHFPMNVSVKDGKLIVKNLIGEKVPRELIIKEGVQVKVDGDIIEVNGANLEAVSQVAADMEQLTRMTDRDRRIFQDGIYITHKAGEKV